MISYEDLKNIKFNTKTNPTIKNIDDFKMSDFELINYKSHDTIKAEMAV